MAGTVKVIDKGDRKQWQADRWETIGASDLATILGYNDYSSAIELFYKKVKGIETFDSNAVMEIGKWCEPLINMWYESYDFSNHNNYIRNYTNGIKFRNTINFPQTKTIINEKFDYLSCTPDSFVQFEYDPNYDFTGGLDSRLFLEMVECKSTRERALKKYSKNFNYTSKVEEIYSPIHLIQLKSQMMICEIPKGKLVYLIIDNGDFVIHEFEYDKKCFIGDLSEEDVLDKARDFMVRVKKARLYETERKKDPWDLDFNNKCSAEIVNLEPEIDGGKALSKWLSDYYKNNNSIDNVKNEIKANEEDEKYFEVYYKLEENSKAAVEDFDRVKNYFKNRLKDGGTLVLEGGKKLYIQKNNVINIK